MNRPPQVEALKTNLAEGQLFPLADMFTVFDPDNNDEITAYRLSEQGPLAGQFVITGPANTRLLGLVDDLQNGLTIEITADELGSFSYQAATFTASETFTISASDGDVFSLPSTNFVSTGNTPPNINAVPSTTGIGAPILFETMFTGEDIETEIQTFQVRDNGRNIVNGTDVSGFFQLDGVRLAPNVFHEVRGDELSRFRYVGGTVQGVETFTIQASDGVFSSGRTTQSVATGNSRPTIATVGSLRVPANQRIAASSLFQIADADGDPGVRYFVADQNATPGSGFWELNGVRQPADQVFRVEGADLNTLFFVGADAGRATDSVRVQVFDGFTFSEPEVFQVVTSAKPVVTPANTSVPVGTSVQASELFNVTDADGDAPQVYFFVDRNTNADGGSFFLNGVQQTPGRFFRITADQLDGLVYRSSNTSQTEQIGIQVIDGADKSDVTNITVGSTSPPSVTGTTGTVRPFAFIDVAPLVNFSDPDGGPAVRYRIEDVFAAGNTGQFELDGNRFPQSTAFEVTAAQFERLQYRGGTFGPFTEPIRISAFDGEQFSPVSTFNITTVRNAEAPVVVPRNINARVGTIIDFRSMFTVSDAGGDAIRTVGFFDTGSFDNSGFFTIDGVQQPSNQFIEVDIDLVNAGRVQYQVAGVSSSEPYRIFATDGTNRSTLATGVSNAIVTPTVATPINDISLDTLETTPVTDTVNPDGTITPGLISVAGAEAARFQVFDANTEFASGRLLLDGQRLTQGVVVTLTADEFSRLQFEGAIVDRGRQLDPILVRAESTVTGFSEWTRVNVNTDPGIQEDQLNTTFRLDNLRGEAPGEPTQITYSFLDGGDLVTQYNRMRVSPALPTYFRTGFGDTFTDAGEEVFVTRGLNGNQREAIRGALDNLESFANVDFIEVPYEITGADAQIVYGSYEFQGDLSPASAITRGPGPAVVRDGAGNIVLEPVFDNEGNPIGEAVLDADGNPIFDQQFDALGNPIFVQEEDEFGNPVFENVLDENGDIALEQVFDVNGNPVLDGMGNPTFRPLLTPSLEPFLVQRINGAMVPVLDQSGILDGRDTPASDIFFDVDDFDPIDFEATEVGSSFYTLGLTTALGALGAFLPADLSIFADFDFLSVQSGNGIEGGITDPFDTTYGDGSSIPPDLRNPASLPLYDIIALQALYGENANFNTDNNQYRFNEARQQTLWDAGGSDAINFTTSTVDESIDLRQGQFSTILGVPQSLRIAYNTVIENARGGSGNDTLIGNETKNYLFGNDGDDVFEGGGGNDVFRGGNGNDIYRWSFGDGRDLIIEQNTLVNTIAQPNLRDETIDILEIRDPTAALDSLEDDFTFRRFGDDLRIDLTFNQGPGQGTVTIRDFANEDSQVERLRLFDNQGLQISEVDLTSIFDAATTQPQRFAVTGTRLADPTNPNGGTIGIATPV